MRSSPAGSSQVPRGAGRGRAHAGRTRGGAHVGLGGAGRGARGAGRTWDGAGCTRGGAGRGARGAGRGGARPAYRWYSARRSSPGCIRTCRPCRCRARRSAGGRLSGCTLGPSSLLHSGRRPPCRRRASRSPRNRSLGGEREEAGQERRAAASETGSEGEALRLGSARDQVKNKVAEHTYESIYPLRRWQHRGPGAIDVVCFLCSILYAATIGREMHMIVTLYTIFCIIYVLTHTRY